MCYIWKCVSHNIWKPCILRSRCLCCHSWNWLTFALVPCPVFQTKKCKLSGWPVKDLLWSVYNSSTNVRCALWICINQILYVMSRRKWNMGALLLVSAVSPSTFKGEGFKLLNERSHGQWYSEIEMEGIWSYFKQCWKQRWSVLQLVSRGSISSFSVSPFQTLFCQLRDLPNLLNLVMVLVHMSQIARGIGVYEFPLLGTMYSWVWNF